MTDTTTVPDSFFADMERRLGRRHLERRVRMQVDHTARIWGGGLGTLHWENLEIVPVAADLAMRLLWLQRQGHRSTLDFRVEHHVVRNARIPRGADGLRILHLSDLHLDGMLDGGARLRQRLGELRWDLCLLTGDYRVHTVDRFDVALARMVELSTVLECPLGIYGVLGNHDFLEMVPGLEQAGITMLLNEAVPVVVGGDTLWIAGVDDAHFYGAHDLDRALRGIPSEELVLLLSHTPELYREAAQTQVDVMLCGHTHGGQICLPGGVALLTNAAVPRRLIAGPWRQGRLQGYTSRGTGSSGVQLRYNCPPEITLHRLSSTR